MLISFGITSVSSGLQIIAVKSFRLLTSHPPLRNNRASTWRHIGEVGDPDSSQRPTKGGLYESEAPARCPKLSSECRQLDGECCGVYRQDLGEHMQKRLEDMTWQKPQPDSPEDGLFVGPETRFSEGETAEKDLKPTRDWHEVAKQIVEEQDGKKIPDLCEELIRALDDQEKHIA
jgi:hypothetical protein